MTIKNSLRRIALIKTNTTFVTNDYLKKQNNYGYKKHIRYRPV